MSLDRERYLLQSFRMVNLSRTGGYLTGLGKGLARVAGGFDFLSISWLAEAYHRRAVALAERFQDPDLLGSAYISLRFHLWAPGRWDGAIENGRQGAEACQKAGNLHGWGLAVWVMAFSLAYRGEFARALAQPRSSPAWPRMEGISN